MVSQKELRELIDRGRDCGAVVRTWNEPPYDSEGHGIITSVLIRRGVPGAGPGWMPPIQAAEFLREFLTTKGNEHDRPH